VLGEVRNWSACSQGKEALPETYLAKAAQSEKLVLQTAQAANSPCSQPASADIAAARKCFSLIWSRYAVLAGAGNRLGDGRRLRLLHRCRTSFSEEAAVLKPKPQAGHRCTRCTRGSPSKLVSGGWGGVAQGAEPSEFSFASKASENTSALSTANLEPIQITTVKARMRVARAAVDPRARAWDSNAEATSARYCARR
jgi:hypothetical protein